MVLACTPKKQAFSTVFDPPQLHERGATELHIWPNVYLADSLLREPIRIVRAQPEQTVAHPKHGYASCSHGTFLPAALRAAILGVSFITGHGTIQMPTSWRNTSSIHCLRPASCLLRGVVPVSPTGTKGSLPRIFWMGTTYRIRFLKSSSYTTRNSTDSNHPTRHQSAIFDIICIIVIMQIMQIMALIAIMCILHINTIFRIIICFQGRNKGTIEGLGSSVGHSSSREQEQYTSIPDCVLQYNESSIMPGGRIMMGSMRWLP